MSTSVVEWFKPPISKDRIIGLVESWTAAVQLLIAVGLILFVVGASSLLLAGTIYLTLVSPADLPDLRQLFLP